MPSPFKLRERLTRRLKLRLSSRGGANTSVSSTPPSVRTVATTTAGPSTTIAAPAAAPAAAPSTRTIAALSRNSAFTHALQQHLAKLSPVENAAFRSSDQTLTAESILVKVRDYDRDYNSDSGSRKCAEQVEKSLRILNQFLRSIAIAIQSVPEVSLLIVGGVKFILDLGLKFVTFFRKLSDMIEEIFEYIDPLQEFDCASDKSDHVRKTLSDVYGDLLDFCRQARLVFVDDKGQPRKYISIITFLRVQWEPFETRFGKVSSNFEHHRDVLNNSVQALQYNAILDGNRATEVERQLAQERDAEEMRRNFMHWICITDFEKEHTLTFEKRYKDTCDWLLKEPEFQQWFEVTDSRVLWCYGK
ncbi:hypothetical protein MMC31_005644, partial [Peltigera leucophlebia]|nr:hypothetical protein [Peltigera leucophlebia]